jgi:hypothetical protein
LRDRDEIEALRIATTIRVLVHDTPRSSSLLGQMKLKNSIKFLDSAIPTHPVPAAEANVDLVYYGPPGLVAIRSYSMGGKFIPLFSEIKHKPSYILFDNWWETPCIPQYNGSKYSRAALVDMLANKEGGAHVDPAVNEAYREYIKNSPFGSSFYVEGVDLGFTDNAAYASMRQVGWELLESLKPLAISR